MSVVVRDANMLDLHYILNSRWRGMSEQELQKYCSTHFESDGRPRHFLTGYSEKVWVAELRGVLAGYVHFFTDCWDGYTNNILCLAVDPSLASDDAQIVREKLEEEVRLEEP